MTPATLTCRWHDPVRYLLLRITALGNFVGNVVSGNAVIGVLLPALFFAVAIGLSFSTGTSWGTFGIMIPIVTAVINTNNVSLLALNVAAVLAGAVCGDHISPISDTTILASAGAQCNHINHVSTQIPYAMTVAGCAWPDIWSVDSPETAGWL